MMEEKLKLMLFRIIYNKINLKEVDQKFAEIKVPAKKIVNNTGEELISKYFFLQNNVNLDRLTVEESKFIELCLSNLNEENKSKLNQFLEDNIYRLLLPDTDKHYIRWPDDNHMAPSNYIVLAFHTLDYLDGETEETRNSRDDIVYPELDRIEYDSDKKYGLRIAVLKYNEVPINIERFYQTVKKNK